MRTFKRFFASFMVVVLLLTVAPLSGFLGVELPNIFDVFASAESYSGTCGENLTWSLDTETGELVISGSGAMENYRQNYGMPVKKGTKLYFPPWYEDRLLIKSITIENGVTSLGVDSFGWCENLNKVNISDSVTSINSQAFYLCNSLSDLKIPDSVTTVGSRAFSRCNIVSITIPNSVTTIESGAFSDCDSLMSITLPDNITTLEAEMFSGCDSLMCVEIPDGVVTIGNSTFNDCDNLTSIEMPDSVTTIEESAFAHCDKLSQIVLHDGITNINSYAFENCDSLVTVELPNNMVNIADGMFESCDKLANIVIGNNVTDIGYGAFQSCYSLKGIVIPDSVINIGIHAFTDCYSLSSVVLGKNVKNIGFGAFQSCRNLTGIEIGDSVEVIDDAAFAGCYRLAFFEVSVGNTAYSSDEYGVLFNKDVTELIQYPAGNTREKYVIPDSAIVINSGAFQFCNNLTHIEIPESVTSIFEFCFLGCKNLEVFSVSDDNEEYSSDEYGVLYNKSKTTLIQYPTGNTRANYNIADGVMIIEDYAFVCCDSLSSITIPNGVITIGVLCFAGCSNLVNIQIPESVSVIDAGAFAYCIGIDSIAIPNDNTDFEPASVFLGCANLERIIVSESNLRYSTDEQGVLYDKGKMTIVYAPAKSVGESYIMPPTVTGVGWYAFVDCSNFSLTFSDAFIPPSDGFFEYISVNEFVVSENNPYLTTVDGVLYDKEVKMLVKYPVDSQEQLFVIPETVEEIYDEEFCFVSLNYSVETFLSLFYEGLFWNFNKIQEKLIRTPYLLTVHSCFSLFEISYGPSHTYVTEVSEEAVAEANLYQEKKKEYLRHEFESFVRNCKDEYNSEEYLWIESFLQEGIDSISHYVVCNGDHTQLHPNPEIKEQVEPGCGANSNGADGYSIQYCASCDTEYTVILKAEGHKHKGTVSEPTCTEKGYTTYVCECGDTYVDDYVDNLGHSFGDWKVTTPSTCTVTGVETRYCSRCDAKETKEAELADHVYDTVKVTDPTCTVKGYTTNKCVCGDSYNTDFVDALGHDFSEWTMTTPGTCKIQGEETKFCSRCDITQTRTTPIVPTNHTKGDWLVMVPATPSESGMEVQKCTGCEVILDTRLIPKLGRVNSVSINNVSMNYKDSATITPSIGVDAGVEYTVTYSSSNPSVASVDVNGKISTGKTGSATITVTVTDEFGNTVTDTCEVKVSYNWWQWIVVIILFGWIWY